MIEPYRIAALRVQGRTQTALEAFRAYDSEAAHLQITAFVGPETLADAGLLSEARELCRLGAERARVAGSHYYRRLAEVTELKIVLRGDREPSTARRLLARLDDDAGAMRYGYLQQVVEMLRGAVLLRDGQDAHALATLRKVVSDMTASVYLLDVPTAAVYLAEAEWRCGNEAEADAAAELARASSSELQTWHPLFQALTEYPAVLSRILDAQSTLDSDWHVLARSVVLQGRYPGLTADKPQVVFRDLGRCRLDINGQHVRFRLSKSAELLAYLLTRPRQSASRQELLGAVLGTDDTPKARSYLRQVLKGLRDALPEHALLTTDGHIALSHQVSIDTESTMFGRCAVEATRLHGAARIASSQKAQQIYERGTYLHGLTSEWIDKQRSHLEELSLENQLALARELSHNNQPLEAANMVDKVLDVDPYRELAWQLKIRIARDFNDLDTMRAAYRQCERALQNLGIVPSATTRELLRQR
ncbi:AfsR/SARP family transcriptional regulator [Streptomyces sp. CA-100214]